jgi:hypothetical protein
VNSKAHDFPTARASKERNLIPNKNQRKTKKNNEQRKKNEKAVYIIIIFLLLRSNSICGGRERESEREWEEHLYTLY